MRRSNTPDAVNPPTAVWLTVEDQTRRVPGLDRSTSMRPAIPTDLQAIRKLLDAAFAPSRSESGLVDALAKNARPIHHWVIDSGAALLAYICYSRAYREEVPVGYHLAPVAVHPEHQRHGHGSRIIRESLIRSPIEGTPVFVLGDPAFYARFGFRKIRQPVCPFEPGNEHFMALRYEARDEFQVGYEPEFMIGESDGSANGSQPIGSEKSST